MSQKGRPARSARNAVPRLLFLEFLCRYEQRCETSMAYPFLKGLARDCGVPSSWLYFVVTPRVAWDRPAGRVLRAELPDEELAALRRRIAEFRPSHIVVNEVPGPGLRAALQGSGASRWMVLPSQWDTEAFHWGEQDDEVMGPYLALLDRDERDGLFKPRWFLEWLGAAGQPRSREHLFDVAEPDYEAEAGGSEGADFPVIIVGGSSCKGRPSVAGNPRFRGLDAARLSKGCSFCGGSQEKDAPDCHGQDPLALAEKQLRRHQAADPERRRGRSAYLVHDLGLFFRIEEFFAMVRRCGFAPSHFVFCPRIDDVLRMRPHIEAVLPVAAAGGHRMRLEIMGIENFDPKVMQLYNKDVTLAQVDGLLALMKRWHGRWPDVFTLFQGGKNWLMLLFTPWSTLRDLRVNFAEAARRGFAGDQLWICSSLLLRRGTPLAALAEKEGGIIAPEFEDRGLLFFPAFGIRNLWGSIPWRFQDRRVADFFRILVRVFAAVEHEESRPLFGDDPEFELFRRIYCDEPEGSRAPPRRPPWSLLDVARELLARLASSRKPRPREELLRAAVARVKAATPARPASAAPGSGPSEEAGALPPEQQAAIDGVSRMLAARGTPSLAGVTIESAGRIRGGDIRLALRVEGRPLVLGLLGPGSPEPAFFVSARFKVVYWNSAPPRAPEDMKKVRLLVALIERRLAK